MQRLWARLIAALYFVVAILPPGYAGTVTETNAELAKRLARAIAGSIPGDPGDRRVRKWFGPIRFSVVGITPNDVRLAIDEDLRLLISATGLDALVVDPAAANFLVMASNNIVDDALGRYRSLTLSFINSEERARQILTEGDRERPCQANARFVGFEITGVIIFVGSADSQHSIGICMREKLPKALGLFRDDFRATDQRDAWAETEMLLLRVLYDTRLRPGMSEVEAEQIARQIFSEIRPEL